MLSVCAILTHSALAQSYGTITKNGFTATNGPTGTGTGTLISGTNSQPQWVNASGTTPFTTGTSIAYAATSGSSVVSGSAVTSGSAIASGSASAVGPNLTLSGTTTLTGTMQGGTFAGFATNSGTTQYVLPVAYPATISGTVAALADATIDLCQEYITNTNGVVPNNTQTWCASGSAGSYFGSVYGSYTRDLAMMIHGRPERFSAQQILNAITLIGVATGTSGVVPEFISLNGNGGFESGFPGTTDNGFEWIDMVYSHFLKTGYPTAYVTFSGTITKVLGYAAASTSNNLIYITPSLSNSNTQEGWGFQDQEISTGYEAVCSEEMYRSYSELAVMDAAASGTMSASYAATASAIQASLITYLWDGANGLMMNSTVDNSVDSPVATAFGIYCGAITGTAATAASVTLNAELTATNSWNQGGYCSHLLKNAYPWSRFRNAVTLGTYQNGGYWSTFTGWFANALALTNTTNAISLVQQYASSTYGTPLLRPFESITSGSVGNTSGVYGAAATGPYEYFRTVLDYAPTGAALVDRANAFTAPQAFNVITSTGSNKDLVITPSGSGRIFIGGPAFAGSGSSGPWNTAVTSSTTAGGIVMNGGASGLGTTSPPISQYHGQNLNMSWVNVNGSETLYQNYGETTNPFKVAALTIGGLALSGSNNYAGSGYVSFYYNSLNFGIGFFSNSGTTGDVGLNVDTASSNNHGIRFTAGTYSSSPTSYGYFPSNGAFQNLVAGGSWGFSDGTKLTGTSGVAYVNGTALVTNGASLTLASANLTAITSATTVATYSTTATVGTYRIGGYLNVASVSVDVIQFQVAWTDENSNSRTQIFYPMGATTPGLGATGFTAFSPADIRAKASSTITVSTVLTTGAGSITYDVGATVQQTN
jgi:hypothetical protein